MAHVVNGRTLSHAWLGAMEHLLRVGGRDVNLAVTFQSGVEEHSEIREVVDHFLEERGLPEVQTVANTIFPEGLYLPEKLPDTAREHLYQHYAQFYGGVGRRCTGNAHGTYFYRMMAWNASKHPVNQVETVIRKLRGELSRSQPGPKSSMYEIALSDPDDEAEIFGANLRIQSPDQDAHLLMGFPCMSHISLTYAEGRLHLAALYRNQYFVEKAYGNYLGLARLLRFICRECGAACQPGEILCVASHADGQCNLGKNRLQHLVERCQIAAGEVSSLWR